jgi:hypothetical protein
MHKYTHTLAIEGVDDWRHTSVVLRPAKRSCTCCKEGWMALGPLLGFEPLTVHPLASRCTDNSLTAAQVYMCVCVVCPYIRSSARMSRSVSRKLIMIVEKWKKKKTFLLRKGKCVISYFYVIACVRGRVTGTDILYYALMKWPNVTAKQLNWWYMYYLIDCNYILIFNIVNRKIIDVWKLCGGTAAGSRT